jgi:hypothetical protein
LKLIVGSKIANIQRILVTPVKFLVKTVKEFITASITHMITFKIKKFTKPIIDVLQINEKT